MLNILYSIIYGIIEGITEWLPISSTGHLILVEQFLKFENVSPEFWSMFQVVIQLGAILAVVLLYFKKIWPITKNKEKAIKILQTRLYDLKMQEREKELGEERRSKIGTGDRSEKIRTYNYPQNRVTDHRINFSTMTLDRVMDGELDPIIDALQTEDLRLKLAGESFE